MERSAIKSSLRRTVVLKVIASSALTIYGDDLGLSHLRAFIGPGFKIATKLASDRRVALRAVTTAMKNIPITARRQDKRLDYEPVFARRKPIMSERLLFQRHLYSALDSCEKAVEGHSPLTLNLFAGRFVKHLYRTILRYNSRYAIAGICRVLCNIPTKHALPIYDYLSDPLADHEETKCSLTPQACKEAKGVIFRSLEKRFGKMLMRMNWERGEYRFLDLRNRYLMYPPSWPSDRPELTNESVYIIKRWMDLLGPWPTNPGAPLDKRTEIDLLRRLLSPASIDELFREQGLGSLERSISFPLMAGLTFSDPSEDGDADVKDITDAELEELESELSKPETRAPDEQLQVVVDSVPVGWIELGRSVRLEIDEDSELIQIVGADSGAVISAHLISFGDAGDAVEFVSRTRERDIFSFRTRRVRSGTQGIPSIYLDIRHGSAGTGRIGQPETDPGYVGERSGASHRIYVTSKIEGQCDGNIDPSIAGSEKPHIVMRVRNVVSGWGIAGLTAAATTIAIVAVLTPIATIRPKPSLQEVRTLDRSEPLEKQTAKVTHPGTLGRSPSIAPDPFEPSEVELIEAEVQLRHTLFVKGWDLGEDIRLERSRNAIVLSGTVSSAPLAEEMHLILAGIPYSTVQIKPPIGGEVPEGKPLAATIRQPVDEPMLADKLSQVFPIPDRRQEFVNGLLVASDEVVAHALVLKQLAVRFDEPTITLLGSEHRRMVREIFVGHLERLESANRRLEPLLALLTTGDMITNQQAGSWRLAIDVLLSGSRRQDHVVTTLLVRNTQLSAKTAERQTVRELDTAFQYAHATVRDVVKQVSGHFGPPGF